MSWHSRVTPSLPHTRGEYGRKAETVNKPTTDTTADEGAPHSIVNNTKLIPRHKVPTAAACPRHRARKREPPRPGAPALPRRKITSGVTLETTPHTQDVSKVTLFVPPRQDASRAAPFVSSSAA